MTATDTARDFCTDALVIRELAHGEHDKILTLLSPERGKITAIAKGARSLRSKLLGSARAFTWANFELHRKGDLCWVRDASVIEPFAQLEKDVEDMYLAQYFADVCCELSGEGVPAGEILRLTLNSYYAVCRKLFDKAKIKAVFEFRAAVTAGYMPDLAACEKCGKTKAENFYLDVMNGDIKCSECVFSSFSAPPRDDGTTDADGARTILLPLSPAVLAAMRYVEQADAARVFSFELRSAGEMRDFAHICETYLLNHLGRSFSSLTVYKDIGRI